MCPANAKHVVLQVPKHGDLALKKLRMKSESFFLMHRLSGLLPRISYLTRMDRLILGVITLVFITLGEAVTTSVLALHNKEKLAHRLDSWFRIIYIVLFVIFMLNAFVL